MKIYWADGNGGRRQANFMHFLGRFDTFPGDATVGALAYVDGEFFLFNGEEWVPFCTCEPSGGTEPEPEYHYEYDPVAPYGIYKYWLPFTNELTDDVYWNDTEDNRARHKWTAYGSPKIENGKFKADGNSFVSLDTFSIGKQDFTIDCWAQMDSSVKENGVIFSCTLGNFFVRRRGTETQALEIRMSDLRTDGANFFGYIGTPSPLTERFHLALVYRHPRTEGENGLWQVYFNGERIVNYALTVTSRPTGSSSDGAFKIGYGTWQTYYRGEWGGTIENLRIVDGVALWTENFTPPDSYAEYAAQMNAIPDSASIPAAREHPEPEPYLKIWLPFDQETTAYIIPLPLLTSIDKCGNYWNASYHTIINSTNATGGNALELNLAHIRTNDLITFGGADFGIDFYGYFDGNSRSGAAFFAATEVTEYIQNIEDYLPRNGIIFGHKVGGSNFTCYVCNARGNRIAEGLMQNLLDELHNFRIDYYHAQSRLKVFIDEQLATTLKVSIPRAKRFVFLGLNPPQNTVGTVKWMKGAIGEFKLYDGRTIYEYVDTDEPAIPAEDVWRYENAGTADTLTIAGTTLTNLPETQSKTGSAFYQTTRAKCFDLPATGEVWIKFDVYFNGSNRWRAYNGGANGITGITAQTSGQLSFFANDTNRGDFAGICKTNTLQTILLHMVSGSSDGVIEAWVDGEKIYRYTGDVNHGEDFADLYLQSDGAGTFFSNVIISNSEP